MRREIAALAVLSVAGMSQANGKFQGLPVGFSIRGGGILAQDSELQHKSNGWFGFGVDLNVGAGLWSNSETFISLDAFAKEGDNVMILNINQRFFGAETPTGQRIYLIAGLGAAKFDIDDDDDTVFGGRIGVGMEFTKNFFGEASLFLSGKTDNMGFRTNALGFYIGARL